MKINFITTNKLKVEIASSILKKYGVKVVQKNIEIPEIQALDSEEVSKFSALYAARKLRRSVIKTDVNYAIGVLNGFPGPLVKFINGWLSAKDILRLLEGKKNRAMRITEYLSYATPGGKVITFHSVSIGRIATKISDDSKGSTFDKILIRSGYDKPQNMLDKKTLDELFYKEVKIWHDFGKYLLKKYKLRLSNRP